MIAIGDTGIAVQFSTAKDPAAINPARPALNYWALRCKQHREAQKDPGTVWGGLTNFATRVEMLTPGYGYTVRLSSEEAEEWRRKIGHVAEAVTANESEKNIGPHCSTCFWQPHCWDDLDDDGVF